MSDVIQLQRLEQYEHELTYELPEDHTVVVRPGLIATVYFENGSQPEVRRGIVACFDRFYELFGEQLRGGFFGDGKFAKKDRKGYEAMRDKALQAGPHDVFQIVLCSESKNNVAPEYGIKTLTKKRLLDVNEAKSYLKIMLPWRMLAENGGLERYHQLVTFICNNLKVQHGYGGLSPLLPYDYDRYMPCEFDLAQRFSGLEVDALTFAFTLRLQQHIKGVNWYTILGDRFVDKLGGEASLRSQLDLPEVVVDRYEHGLLIRAGKYPSLGAPEDGPPAPYVAVNSVVKSLRLIDTGQLHTYMADGLGFGKESTARWYTRFDIPESEPAPPTVTRLRAEPGERCPKGGWWASPAMAQPVLVRQGDPMPGPESTSYGSVIWNFVREPDPGTV